MAARRRPALSLLPAWPKAPPHYTAQDVARICQVDLKTIHHWVDKGRFSFRRTKGGHLRFRRNDVVAFLAAHGFPVPESVARVRCTVSVALGDALSKDDVLRLGARFDLAMHTSAIEAIVALGENAPDALVVSLSDGTLGPSALEALRIATNPMVIGAVAAGESERRSSERGANFVCEREALDRLDAMLCKALAIDEAVSPTALRGRP